ncbi:MAG: molybdate ABC transporter substrate-binding protein [Rhodospirillales bacterium]|nr:molybdate ABC transporter substrate-binding protein [Rhodospirillales bacterium]
MKRHPRKIRSFAFALGLGLLVLLDPPTAAAELRLFAAASTTTVMDELIALYDRNGGGSVVASYASSSTLAKQIVNGAPADIFISANQSWMDHLAKNGAIEPASRRDLLTNRLVLVAPADTTWTLAIGPGFPLAAALDNGRLAMGDPDHVPAGIYGRQALGALGVWDAVADRVARAADVRGALVLVERGEAPAGIVYATDAAVTPKVRVVDVFPETSHPPIRYPAAIVVGRATPEVERFFAFLASDAATAVYARFGFGLASGPAPR